MELNREQIAYYQIMLFPFFEKVCSYCGYAPLNPTKRCAYCGRLMVTKKEYKRRKKSWRKNRL